MGDLRSRRGAVAALGALLSTSLLAGQAVVSDAAWRQDEHVHAGVGTLDCSRATGFATRGAGRLVGGSLLGQDAASLAAVSGVTATSDGSRSRATSPAEPVGQGTWANPLAVGALSAVRLSVSGALDDVLEVGTGNPVGAVNQVAHADTRGGSFGASGVVSDSGVVMLDERTPASPPRLGRVRLSRLVESLTGRAVSQVAAGVTDLSLEVGALSSAATLDACRQAWDDDDPTAVRRQYAVAGLDAELRSPLVAGLSTRAGTALDGLSGTVAGLAGDAGVVGAIGSGVAALLSSVLGGLRLGAVAVTGPQVDLDLTAVRRLTSATVTDRAGTASLDLATGTVRVDLAALLGPATGGHGLAGGSGLNQLAPNTELVLDAAVANTLVARLGQALDDWVRDVVAAARSALLLARVRTTVRITLQGTVQLPLAQPVTLDVARVDTVVDATLADLLAGRGGVSASVQVLNGTGGLGVLVNALVTPLIGGLVGALTAGAGPVVGRVLDDVLLDGDSALSRLGSTLAATTGPVVTALSTVVNAYLGAQGLVSLVANAQNDPATGARYADWESRAREVPTGQYDVAALALRVPPLLGPGQGLSLELSRASVGRSCRVVGQLPTGACTGY